MRTPAMVALVLILPLAAPAQEAPTWDDLAASPETFLTLMDMSLAWRDPVPPARIAGPLSFVGTKGLGVYLVETSQGLILINTGMPGSGPMIEASIRALGLDPADIRIILAGHGHIDHAAGHAYLRALSGAEVAMMEPDVPLLETGGAADMFYDVQPAFAYDPVTVDRVLRDGDRIVLGDMAITALHTPGHTRGATTFVFDVVDGGVVYNVVIPDGTGVNPGYRVATDTTYPGNGDDYRRTYHRLELLRPDIWLPLHTENAQLHAKIAASATDGAAAFVDPMGYARFIRVQRTMFERRVDAEEGGE